MSFFGLRRRGAIFSIFGLIIQRSRYTEIASSDVAERLLRDIDKTARRLLRHPMSGRLRSDIAPSLRSVLVQPYAILYRVTDTSLDIVRILHTRRDFAVAFSQSG